MKLLLKHQKVKNKLNRLNLTFSILKKKNLFQYTDQVVTDNNHKELAVILTPTKNRVKSTTKTKIQKKAKMKILPPLIILKIKNQKTRNYLLTVVNQAVILTVLSLQMRMTPTLILPNLNPTLKIAKKTKKKRKNLKKVRKKMKLSKKKKLM